MKSTFVFLFSGLRSFVNVWTCSIFAFCTCQTQAFGLAGVWAHTHLSSLSDSPCTRMESRALSRVDSNCDTSLSQWQIRAKAKVQDMYNEAHLNRIPLWKLVQHLAGNPTEDQALNEVTFLICMSEGVPNEQAYASAQEILSSRASKQTGSSTTCPLQWRFDSETLWHEPPANPKIARIARSILGKSFFKAEPISSRTFDMSVPDGKSCVGASHLETGRRVALARGSPGRCW